MPPAGWQQLLCNKDRAYLYEMLVLQGCLSTGKRQSCLFTLQKNGHMRTTARFCKCLAESAIRPLACRSAGAAAAPPAPGSGSPPAPPQAPAPPAFLLCCRAQLPALLRTAAVPAAVPVAAPGGGAAAVPVAAAAALCWPAPLWQGWLLLQPGRAALLPGIPPACLHQPQCGGRHHGVLRYCPARPLAAWLLQLAQLCRPPPLFPPGMLLQRQPQGHPAVCQWPAPPAGGGGPGPAAAQGTPRRCLTCSRGQQERRCQESCGLQHNSRCTVEQHSSALRTHTRRAAQGCISALTWPERRHHSSSHTPLLPPPVH